MVNKVKENVFEKRLKALLDISKTNAKKFKDAEARVSIYPKTSVALPKTKVQELNSIASPLTEKENSRNYYDEAVLWDSTGFFSIAWKPLQQVTFLDAKGQEIVFIFSDPSDDT